MESSTGLRILPLLREEQRRFTNVNRLCRRAGTKSPLTTNQQTSSGWVLPVSTTRRNNQMETATNYGSWPRQRPRRRGDRSKRERLDDVFIHSWAASSGPEVVAELAAKFKSEQDYLGECNKNRLLAVAECFAHAAIRSRSAQGIRA
ncbi:hypothetical protein ACH5RR_003158 [Cinchona calisaya]|uniref:Uncharacterized protein n=1 Tax=Cinchona calisaya TaxID=153742 RepID=A0ABD3AU03_9GENT